MNPEISKFDSQLHEDLFDLFIMAIISNGGMELAQEPLLNYCREYKDCTFYMFRDLFPLENHPEQYEMTIRAGDVGVVANRKDRDVKVKITVENEG